MTPNDHFLHDRALHVCWYAPAGPENKAFLGFVAATLFANNPLSKEDRQRAEDICSQHGKGAAK